MKNLSYLLLIAFLFSCQRNQPVLQMENLNAPTSSLLQAVSIVDEKTVWLSGHDASLVISVNQGKSWELFQHPTGDTLQFRDIYGFNDQKAIVMSAGQGPLSRIFTFTIPDKWRENFVMSDSLGFLDCLDFWDDQRGIAYGDAIDSYPYILITNDGGQSWSRTDTTHLPLAGKGEGGFAASGTCITVGENGKAWIATGAGGNSRFLITQNYGVSWKEVDSPIIKGDAAGNTSITFVGDRGFVTGGDLLKPEDYMDNCAFSMDGGETWTLTNQPVTKGAFYGSALTKVGDQYIAFVCGPKGLDYTSDKGLTWTNLDTLNYWAMGFTGNIGFASGTDGKILKISLLSCDDPEEIDPPLP